MDYLKLIRQGVDQWNACREQHPNAKPDLRQAKLINVFLFEGNFCEAILNGANLQGACLIGADLQRAQLRGANLRGAYLNEANLQGADLTGAILSEANLIRANLQNARLADTKAIKTNFSRAVITGACLEGWQINSDTQLSDVQCQYVFLDVQGQERCPSHRKFRPDEFTRLFETTNIAARPPALKGTAASARPQLSGERLRLPRRSLPAANPLPSGKSSRKLSTQQKATPFLAQFCQPRLKELQENNIPSTLHPLPSTVSFPDTSSTRGSLTGQWTLWQWIGIGMPATLLIMAGVYGLKSVSQQPVSQPPIVPDGNSPQAANNIPDTTPIVIKRLVLVESLAEDSSDLWAAKLGPDASLLVHSSYNQIHLRDLSTNEITQTLSGHRDLVRSVAISTSGTLLASVGGDETTKLWELSSGKLLQTFSEPEAPVWTVALSPDENTLVSGSYDGQINIWQVNTGTLQHSIAAHSAPVWSVVISSDGQTLYSAGGDEVIKVWDLQSGDWVRTLAGHQAAVRAIALSPDGQTLASGSWDNTLKIWDAPSGELRTTLTGHTDRIVSIAIDTSGQTLASGSLDKTIRVWDLTTGELRQTLTGHSDWVLAVAFSEVGYTLVSSSRDGTLKIWQ